MVSKSKLKKDLVSAYLSACKHKRRKKYVGEFVKNFEQNIDNLASELLDGSYEISPSICFIIESPIKREVIAADFRDRVGKGTLFGIERLEHFVKRDLKIKGYGRYVDDFFLIGCDVENFSSKQFVLGIFVRNDIASSQKKS